jgi:hypothetical protein
MIFPVITPDQAPIIHILNNDFNDTDIICVYLKDGKITPNVA